jgi:hypothetical protein
MPNDKTAKTLTLEQDPALLCVLNHSWLHEQIKPPGAGFDKRFQGVREVPVRRSLANGLVLWQRR